MVRAGTSRNRTSTFRCSLPRTGSTPGLRNSVVEQLELRVFQQMLPASHDVRLDPVRAGERVFDQSIAQMASGEARGTVDRDLAAAVVLAHGVGFRPEIMENVHPERGAWRQLYSTWTRCTKRLRSAWDKNGTFLLYGATGAREKIGLRFKAEPSALESPHAVTRPPPRRRPRSAQSRGVPGPRAWNGRPDGGFTDMILVTGGAGFIGANFILRWLQDTDEPVVTLDKLTYAGNLDNLAGAEDDPRHVFVRGDIADAKLVGRLLEEHRPRAVLNFAAESHVDRSIHGPEHFVQTNIVGTFRLLESVRRYWDRLAKSQRDAFRFVHVSTDEVFGSLGPEDEAFRESHPHAPNSPYSASKSASDGLVRAWHHTFGLPVLTSNCSNNYGPFQFPEKLIPLLVVNALAGKPLPVYGDGLQVRDWLFVQDHCDAIRRVLEAGRPGETYNVGGWTEKRNIDIVRAVCRLLDECRPRADGRSYAEQIAFVPDRLGHDRRYAIDARKIERELGWRPYETFDSGLRKTVRWYVENTRWVERVQRGEYQAWIRRQYGGAVPCLATT
jgi:dTDP-glucose 4,6-dehydratase